MIPNIFPNAFIVKNINRPFDFLRYFFIDKITINPKCFYLSLSLTHLFLIILEFLVSLPQVMNHVLCYKLHVLCYKLYTVLFSSIWLHVLPIYKKKRKKIAYLIFAYIKNKILNNLLFCKQKALPLLKIKLIIIIFFAKKKMKLHSIFTFNAHI